METKDIIRILRERRGWTQTRLAEELGVSRSLISMAESGARTPSVDLFEGLSDVFNVDVDYLMGRSNKITILPERLEHENYYLDPCTRQIADDISKDPDLALLFDAARDVKPEDLKTVSELLKSLKRKEQESEDDL